MHVTCSLDNSLLSMRYSSILTGLRLAHIVTTDCPPGQYNELLVTRKKTE